MTRPDSRSLYENLVALGAEFHTHPRYREFYDLRKDSLSGFAGIYAIIISMAQAMGEWEAANPNAYGDALVDWIQLCEDYCDEMIAQSLAQDDARFVAFCGDALHAALKRQNHVQRFTFKVIWRKTDGVPETYHCRAEHADQARDLCRRAFAGGHILSVTRLCEPDIGIHTDARIRNIPGTDYPRVRLAGLLLDPQAGLGQALDAVRHFVDSLDGLAAHAACAAASEGSAP